MMSVCNASGIVLRTAHIFFYLMLTEALQGKYYQPLKFTHSFKNYICHPAAGPAVLFRKLQKIQSE